MITKNYPITAILSTCFLSLVLSNCGRQEGTGGILGAVGGGLAGHAVAGKKNKAAGVLIGGLLGNIVGREIGKEGDKEEAEENAFKEKLKAQERAIQKQELTELQEENARLRTSLVKWCSNCGRRNEIPDAHSCPICGAALIKEKFCSTCATIFSPQSGYKYCPYCKDKVLLGCR